MLWNQTLSKRIGLETNGAFKRKHGYGKERAEMALIFCGTAVIIRSLDADIVEPFNSNFKSKTMLVVEGLPSVSLLIIRSHSIRRFQDEYS